MTRRLRLAVAIMAGMYHKVIAGADGGRRKIMRRTLVTGVVGALLVALVLMTMPSVVGAAPSESRTAALRLKKPGAPTALVLTPVNTAIAVSWSAPLSDGGSPVINCLVKVGNGKSPCVSTGPMSCIASGLKNGKSYAAKVHAVNVKGAGPAAKFFAVPTTAENCSYVGPYANLQSCNSPNLFAANLTNANLGGANLSNDSLYYTNFTGANLSGADLTGAGAQNATFTNANLTNANLTNAYLTNAVLAHTTLTNATLTGTDLTNETSSGIVGTPGTLPTGWSLVGGFLVGPGADLLGQDLSGLNLSGADLAGDSIYYTYFGGDNLTGANLTGAGGDNANFTNADLTNANFTNADLYNDNFTGATVTGATWSNTECPDASNSSSDGNTCINNGA
jgi:uncharacterized protein YjbI with pentapeptide repeats